VDRPAALFAITRNSYSVSAERPVTTIDVASAGASAPCFRHAPGFASWRATANRAPPWEIPARSDPADDAPGLAVGAAASRYSISKPVSSSERSSQVNRTEVELTTATSRFAGGVGARQAPTRTTAVGEDLPFEECVANTRKS